METCSPETNMETYNYKIAQVLELYDIECLKHIFDLKIPNYSLKLGNVGNNK